MPRARMNGGVTGYFNLPTAASAGGIWSATEENLYRGSNLFPTDTTGADPQFNLNTILLHGDGSSGANNNVFQDSSTNAFTITRNGTPTQGTFSPFSQTGWSNYFNGSTDYLSITNNSAFNLGSSNFTFECWVYNTIVVSGESHIFGKRASNAVFAPIIMGVNVSSGSNRMFMIGSLNNSTWGIGGTTGAITLPLNQWNHLAITRNGNTVQGWVNGVADANLVFTISGSFFTNTDAFTIGTSATTPPNYFPGYISNFRFVNGTAVYTSAFTPPTSLLTAITNTALLTCQSNRFIDNSTNALTITTSGTPSVQSFSPFAPAAAYGVSSVGGSMYFNGSTDYLSAPNINFGTNNFTIEGWFYFSSFSSNITLWGTDNGVGYNPKLCLVWYTSSQFQLFAPPSVTITFNASPAINSWNHIAIVRSGTGANQTTMYLNGVSAGNGTVADCSSITAPFNIGYMGESFGSKLSGYISNFRIVNGTAVYSSTFTPPSAPVTAIANTQLLVNGTNSGIYDSTAKNDIITYGTAQISTSSSKYGGSSLYFDGTSGGYMTTTGTNQTLIFGTGAFTIEHWVNFSGGTTGGDNNTIGDISGFSTSGNWLFMWNYVAAGKLSFWINNAVVCSTTNAYNNGAWHHVAVTRTAAGAVTIWVDGVADGTGTNTSSVGTGGIMIGNQTGLTRYWTGYIDDIRITNGFARYTNTFTPPPAAFSNR